MKILRGPLRGLLEDGTKRERETLLLGGSRDARE